MSRIWIVATVVLLCATSGPAASFDVELLDVQKIWDQAPHNAFTDLTHWHGAFYCAFREGRGHVSTDGKVRVIRSQDGQAWTSVYLAKMDRFDLRDAHLCVAPNDRLMLLGGAAPREKDGQSAPTGSFVAFSGDGEVWTTPHIVVEPGRWLWSVTWHNGKAYGVSYTAGSKEDRHLKLLTSKDGIHYDALVPRLFDRGWPNEVQLRFTNDGTCYALVRRDGSGQAPRTAFLGISSGDYTQWQWHDLGTQFNSFGGPNLLQLSCGHWVAAGRMHQGGSHTALTHLDVQNKTMSPLLKLPSGGDTSYPGLIEHDGLLYMSYYSSHEGKTSIYLATFKPMTTDKGLIAPGEKVTKLADRFRFTEGPAADAQGNVYFTDIPNNRIHKWSLDGMLTTFRENSGGANGLYFDKAGNLLVCEGGGRRLSSISPEGQVTVLADEYQDKPFNSLNDLWIDPKGGVYFTDPRYGNRDGMEQDGEHVYYLAPDGKTITRVVNDMVRPNGLIGTPDGKTLYITDNGGGKTFVYKVNADGTLDDKKLFCSEGADGMTIDNWGNVYLTTATVAVYNKDGQKIEDIQVPERPSNVTFGGPENKTLFITARTGFYSVKLNIPGARTPIRSNAP